MLGGVPPATMSRTLRTIPATAQSFGGGRADVWVVQSGIANAGTTAVVWRVLHSTRGAWQLVLGRLQLSKTLNSPAEMYALSGDFENACEMVVLDMELPPHGKGRYLANCCAARTNARRWMLAVYVYLEEGRLYRIQVELPEADEPLGLGLPRRALQPMLSGAEIHGDFAHLCVLHAVDGSTCAVGTDTGKLAALQFDTTADGDMRVVPLDGGAGRLLEAAASFFGGGRPSTAAGVVGLCSCPREQAGTLHGTGHVVAAIHTNGRVSVWELHTANTGLLAARSLFHEYMSVDGALVSKGVVHVHAGGAGSMRITVGVTTSVSSVSVAVWRMDAQGQRQCFRVESPQSGGELVGVQVLGWDDDLVAVCLMRSPADKLTLIYQEAGSLEWGRGIVDDTVSVDMPAFGGGPFLVLDAANERLLVVTPTSVSIVVTSDCHELEIDDQRQAHLGLRGLSRMIYRGIGAGNVDVEIRRDVGATFRTRLLQGHRPIQIAVNEVGRLTIQQHEEIQALILSSDEDSGDSALSAVLAEMSSVVRMCADGGGSALPLQDSSSKTSSSSRTTVDIFCGSIQRHYVKQISEGRLDLLQDVLFCLAYILCRRHAINECNAAHMQAEQLTERCEHLVRAYAAMHYLAVRTFSDDDAALDERFAALGISSPCKFVLSSLLMWSQVHKPNLANSSLASVENRLTLAFQSISRAFLNEGDDECRGKNMHGLIALVCHPPGQYSQELTYDRPEIAEKLMAILADEIDTQLLHDELCVALHTLLGHSFARLGRFDAARQHFMSVVKPYVMMAPTPDMHATILQTFNEIMDALHQDPSCALEFAKLAVQSELFLEEMHQQETGWKPRLLSKTFGYALKINDIDSAYHAIICNPDTEERNNNLKMLVYSLHKNNRLELLFKKPLIAVISTANNSDVCLHNDIAHILLDRARAGGDGYYKSLYAFQISQHNFQKAAEAMVAYSECCKVNGAKTNDVKYYQSAADGLMVAINALQQCPDTARWVERQHIAEIQDLDGEAPVSIGSQKRKLGITGLQVLANISRDSDGLDAEADLDTGGSPAEVSQAVPLHISSLEYEHTLLNARLSLFSQGRVNEILPNSAHCSFRRLAEQTVMVLMAGTSAHDPIHHAEYTLAGQLCHHFGADLRPVLKRLATQFVLCRNNRRAGCEASAAAQRLIRQHATLAATITGTEAAWELRGVNAAMPDTGSADLSHHALCRYFAHAVLQLRQGNCLDTGSSQQALPAWIRSGLQECEVQSSTDIDTDRSAGLLGFYLNFGYLTKALRLVLTKLRRDDADPESFVTFDVEFRKGKHASTQPLGLRFECDHTRRSADSDPWPKGSATRAAAVIVAKVHAESAANGWINPSDAVVGVWHKSVQTADAWLIFERCGEEEAGLWGSDRLYELQTILQRAGPIKLRIRRLSHAASDGRACDASVSEAGLLATKSWAMMRSELLHELKRQYGADALHSLKLQIPALGPLGGGFDI